MREVQRQMAQQRNAEDSLSGPPRRHGQRQLGRGATRDRAASARKAAKGKGATSGEPQKEDVKRSLSALFKKKVT